MDRWIPPDAVMWVRGVDYLSGWRDAQEAAAELKEGLTTVGIDLEGPRCALVRRPTARG